MPAHQGRWHVGGLMQDAHDARLHDSEHHDRLAEADEAVVAANAEKPRPAATEWPARRCFALDPIPLGASDDQVLGPNRDRRAVGA